MIETIIGLAIAFMLVICFVLIGVLIREVDKQQPSYHQTLPALPKNDRQLQQILNQLRRDYPDRDERWYWHKAERELLLKQTQAPPVNLATYKPSPQPIAPPPVANINSVVDAKTARKLFALVNSDRKLAHRLLDKAREYYPGRSEQWLWEKVIWDIERDRRA